MKTHPHPFGQVIPYNSDNLPEIGNTFGQGTERPVGFATLDRIALLYWSIRSLRISAAAIPLFDFTFEQFLIGGGLTGSILGSLSGLSLASSSMPVPISFVGKTTCYHLINKKVRLVRDGVYKNLTQEEFFNLGQSSDSSSSSSSKKQNALDIDENIKDNYLGSLTESPKEGFFVAAGPYHRLINRNGAIFINFSDIIYAQRQYWPKVLIFIHNAVGKSVWRSALSIRDPLFSADLTKLKDVWGFSITPSVVAPSSFGGVSFDGGLIKMFGQGDLNTYSIFGAISYPTAAMLNKELEEQKSSSSSSSSS